MRRKDQRDLERAEEKHQEARRISEKNWGGRHSCWCEVAAITELKRISCEGQGCSKVVVVVGRWWWCMRNAAGPRREGSRARAYTKNLKLKITGHRVGGERRAG